MRRIKHQPLAHDTRTRRIFLWLPYTTHHEERDGDRYRCWEETRWLERVMVLEEYGEGDEDGGYWIGKAFIDDPERQKHYDRLSQSYFDKLKAVTPGYCCTTLAQRRLRSRVKHQVSYLVSTLLTR